MDTEQLIIELLALRKIADNVLGQIRAESKSARPKGKSKKVDGVADLTARIVTGGMKPTKLKKRKKKNTGL